MRTGKTARITARVLTAVLALILALAVLAGAGVILLNSQSLRENIATDENVIRQEMEWAEGQIAALSDEYGFKGGMMLTVLTEELMIRQNREAMTWWGDTLNRGIPGLMKEDAGEDLEEAIVEALVFKDSVTEREQDERSGIVPGKVRDVLQSAAFPIRTILTDKALTKAGEKVNIRGMIDAVKQMPLILGLCVLIAAGLIVLLIARDPQQAPEYLGCSMGGGGLLTGMILLLIRGIGIRDILEKANTRLAAQYAVAEGRLIQILAIGGAVLLAAGIACIILCIYRKKGSGREADETENRV